VNEISFKTWMYDGGEDVVDSFALSGEPMAPQLAGMYSSEKKNQFTGAQIAANNVEQREIKKAYLEYWNSTASETSTGRPIDAIISPLAPFPAARPKLYAYYGYTTWVNLLDYTSVVVPITNVDKALDPKDSDYKPLNEEDRVCFESCKCS
jgi:amidase